MKLIDNWTDREISLSELRRDWLTLSEDEPENHADDFMTEMFCILMDTVNGRNDCDVVGLTPSELNNYILKLRDKVEGEKDYE